MDNIESLINKMIKEELKRTLLNEAPNPSNVKAVAKWWQVVKGWLAGTKTVVGKTETQAEVIQFLTTSLKAMPSVINAGNASKNLMVSIKPLARLLKSQPIIKGLIQQGALVGNAGMDLRAQFNLIPRNLRSQGIKDLIKNWNRAESPKAMADNLFLLQQGITDLQKLVMATPPKLNPNQYGPILQKLGYARNANLDDVAATLGRGSNASADALLALRGIEQSVAQLFGDGGRTIGLVGTELVEANMLVARAIQTQVKGGKPFIDVLQELRIYPLTKTKLLIALATGGFVGSEMSGFNDWIMKTIKGFDISSGDRFGQKDDGKKVQSQTQDAPTSIGIKPLNKGAPPIAPTPQIKERTLEFREIDLSEISESDKPKWGPNGLKPGRGKYAKKDGCPHLNSDGGKKFGFNATILYQALMNMGIIEAPPATSEICSDKLKDHVAEFQRRAIKGELRLQKEIIAKGEENIPFAIRNLYYDQEKAGIKALEENKLDLTFDSNSFQIISEKKEKSFRRDKQGYAALAAAKAKAKEGAVDGVIGSRSGAVIALYGTRKGFAKLRQAASGPKPVSEPTRSRSTQSSQPTAKKPPKDYWDLLKEMTKMNPNESLLGIEGCEKGKKPRIHFKFRMISNADGAMREGLEDFARMKKQAEAQLAEILKEEGFEFSIMQAVKENPKSSKTVKKLVKKKLTDNFARQLAEFAKKVEVSATRDKMKFTRDEDRAGSGTQTDKQIIDRFIKDDPLLFYRLIFYKNGDIQYDPDEDIVQFIKTNGVTWLNQDAADLEDSVQRAKEVARNRDKPTTAFRTRLMNITLFAPNKNLEFNDNIDPDGGEGAISRIKSSLRILKDLNSSLDEKADGGGRRVSTRYKCAWNVIEPISGVSLFSGLSNMKYEGTQGQGFMARSVNMFKDSLINGRLKDVYLNNQARHEALMKAANAKITTFIKNEAKQLGIDAAAVTTPFPFYSERDFRREQLFLDPGSKPIDQGDLGEPASSRSFQLYAGILNGLRANMEVCRPLNKRGRSDKLLQIALQKLIKGSK